LKKLQLPGRRAPVILFLTFFGTNVCFPFPNIAHSSAQGGKLERRSFIFEVTDLVDPLGVLLDVETFDCC